MIGIIVGVVVIIVTCICFIARQNANEHESKTWTLPDTLSTLVLSTPIHVTHGESRKALESRQGEIKKMMKILKKCEQVYCLFPMFVIDLLINLTTEP